MIRVMLLNPILNGHESNFKMDIEVCPSTTDEYNINIKNSIDIYK